MAWTGRKSFRRGPIRLNLSKSGVGFSVGVKGLRVGSGPRGAYLSAGRGPFRKKLGASPSRPAPADVDPVGVPSAYETESADQAVAPETRALVEEINERIRRFPFWVPTLVLATVLLFAAPPAGFLVLLLGVGPVFFLLDRPRKTTSLQYDLDGGMQARHERLREAVKGLRGSQVKRQEVQSEENADPKRSAGAARFFVMANLSIREPRPKFLKTDLRVPCIQGPRTRLHFLPDALYIYRRRRYGVLPYSAVQANFSSFQMVETILRPKDAELVGHTWTKVNKDGSPDKRFRDNQQVPKFRYGRVELTDGGAFGVKYHFSNIAAAEAFVRALQEMASERAHQAAPTLPLTPAPPEAPAGGGGRPLAEAPKVTLLEKPGPAAQAPAVRHLRCPGCKSVVAVPAQGKPVCPHCGYGKAKVPA